MTFGKARADLLGLLACLGSHPESCFGAAAAVCRGRPEAGAQGCMTFEAPAASFSGAVTQGNTGHAAGLNFDN